MSQTGRAHLDHERETESDLLLRVREGDMDAFAELAERNEGPAMAVARSIVDPTTAEDVVADSLERLLVVLRRGEGPTYSVRPYFLQMVRNRAIDYRRRNPEIPTDAPVPLPPAPPMPHELDVDAVRTAFDVLPERWQSALWLGVVEGRSNAEIGKELDVAESAASQLLFRAREGLRQTYLDAQIGSDQGCSQLSGLLGKYVRERTSRRDARKVDEHLAECASCRAAVAKTRDLNKRIGAVLAVGVLGGIGLELVRRPATAMAADLAGGSARALGTLRRGRIVRHLVGAAAAVVVTAVLIFAVPGEIDGPLADAIMSVPSSPTPTLTPTPTLSPTPLVTPTPSAPATSSPTASPSRTASQRPKPSPTPTTTPSSTPTPSRSSSPSPTPTPTPTPTPCQVEMPCWTDPPVPAPTSAGA